MVYTENSDFKTRFPKNKVLRYKPILITLLLLHVTYDSTVNAQAPFTFSALSLQPPISSVGSNATATCNVTYTGSTTATLTWKINDVVIDQYRIKNNEVPQYANLASGYDTSSSTTTSIVNTGDTFTMSLEIRNVNLTLNQATVSLSCSSSDCITQVQLQIKVCQPNTSSGVESTVSSSPCGFGCTVQYSCASGYNGNDLNATCQDDATFDAIPTCTLITCLNSDLPCSNPRYCFNETGSTNAGTNVAIQCNTGYSGSVSATCGNDGSWTITTQSPCPALCSVSDITPLPGRCTNATGDILEGQSITVTCCNGYEGASTMANCTSDRSWSNLPTCTKIQVPEGKSLSDGAIAGIVIGCLIVVAIIIVVLIAIFCAEICCCTFSILCLSWGTKD